MNIEHCNRRYHLEQCQYFFQYKTNCQLQLYANRAIIYIYIYVYGLCLSLIKAGLSRTNSNISFFSHLLVSRKRHVNISLLIRKLKSEHVLYNNIHINQCSITQSPNLQFQFAESQIKI